MGVVQSVYNCQKQTDLSFYSKPIFVNQTRKNKTHCGGVLGAFTSTVVLVIGRMSKGFGADFEVRLRLGHAPSRGTGLRK